MHFGCNTTLPSSGFNTTLQNLNGIKENSSFTEGQMVMLSNCCRVATPCGGFNTGSNIDLWNHCFLSPFKFYLVLKPDEGCVVFPLKRVWCFYDFFSSAIILSWTLSSGFGLGFLFILLWFELLLGAHQGKLWSTWYGLCGNLQAHFEGGLLININSDPHLGKGSDSDEKNPWPCKHRSLKRK